MVLKTIPLALLLIAGAAEADCYYRSTTINDIKAKIQRQSEPVREIMRVNDNLVQCTATFRIMIDNVWFTAQGRAQADLNTPEPQICAQAQDAGRARLLQQIRGMETSVSQELVCTDQDIPKWRPVKMGELVRESEVTPDPDHPGSFPYLGMECRRFLETINQGEGLIQNRGVICKLQRGENGGKWKVIQKWVHFRG